jgi:hypothetical protein
MNLKAGTWLTIILAACSIAILLFLPLSCNEYYGASQSDCDSCYSEKPSYGSLTVNLSDKNLSQGVFLKVYKGKYTEAMRNDDSQLEWSDTVYNTTNYIDVKLDEYYSVVAEYTVNGKKYSVIDGDKIKASSIKSTCNYDCWLVRGGKIDCKLKY